MNRIEEIWSKISREEKTAIYKKCSFSKRQVQRWASGDTQDIPISKAAELVQAIHSVTGLSVSLEDLAKKMTYERT